MKLIGQMFTSWILTLKKSENQKQGKSISLFKSFKKQAIFPTELFSNETWTFAFNQPQIFAFRPPIRLSFFIFLNRKFLIADWFKVKGFIFRSSLLLLLPCNFVLSISKKNKTHIVQSLVKTVKLILFCPLRMKLILWRKCDWTKILWCYLGLSSW